MTIDELIEKLEEAKDKLPAGGEAEVLFGHQPNYPLRSYLAGVAVLGQEGKLCPDCEDRYMELVQEADYGSDAKRVWRCPGNGCGATVEEEDLEPNKDNEVCWLVEGGQVYDAPYAPRALWSEEVMI